METRSRSARNATLSFPSKMIFRSRKKEEEKVRMAVETSSLFVPIGESFNTDDPKEAGRIIREHEPCAVVFIPSIEALSSPRSWTGALSSASFVVVIGSGSIAQYRSFMRFLDNAVYSPVPRRLTASFITDSRDRALELLSGASSVAEHTITISSLLER